MSTLWLALSTYLPIVILPICTWFWCFLIGLVSAKRWPGLARTIVLLGSFQLLIFSLPVVGNALVRSLEARYPTPTIDSLEATDVAILLGGGLNMPGGPRIYAELGPGADRLLMTLKLYQAGKVSSIWIAGGNIFNWNDSRSEASHTRDILLSWGVPSDAITLEEQSRNTFENADYFRQSREHDTEGKLPRVPILVTSAIHMRRAVQQFTLQGVDVVPASADHWIADSHELPLVNYIPEADALRHSTRALREYLGHLVYRVRFGDEAITTEN